MNYVSRFSFLALLSIASAPLAEAQFSFTDRTNLLNNSGLGGTECNSGVAIGVIDMNSDGKDDIVRLHDTDILSIETQTTTNGAFGHNVIGNVGITPWALCVADIDKNGFNDIVLGPFGGGIRIYTANSTGTGYSGSQLANSIDIACQGTLFGDLNNDGEIDLFSCHDVGDNGKFENIGGGQLVRNGALMDTDLGSNSSGNYAALWTDFDKDGKLDLYLSKCSQGTSSSSSPKRINRLFKGGSGGYTDVAPALGVDDGAQTWCSDLGDIDNDGDLDLFVLNHGSGSSASSRLLENVNGTFTDITASSGLSSMFPFDGIQMLFHDFDNDGFVDILASSTGNAYRILRNNGNKTFTRQTNAFRVGGSTGGGGVALNYMHSFGVGDLNSDGFLDIYVGRGSGFASSTNESDVLFMNNGNSNHFLTVQLEGVITHRNAIGARVEIVGPWGTQTREVRSGEGYGITNSLSSHFGTGSETVIPEVNVTWPSGKTTMLTNVAVDQILSITEPVDPSDFTTPSITSRSADTATLNSNYTYIVSADNNPQSFSLSNAPGGMTISPSGAVSWVPTATGNFSFEVTATNPAGSDSQTVSLVVQANALPGAFEAEGYLVDTSQIEPWIRQTSTSHDGVDAAKAASITHNESTWLETTVTGPGQATFWWRVSSEQGFDFHTLTVNGATVERRSGVENWRQKTITLGAGTQRIRWTYNKDVSDNAGQDTAWVDEFSYTPDVVDTDSDDLDDNWEIANFGNLSQNGSDDFDGDGQPNSAEQASGTNPTDASSVLQLLSAEALAGKQVQLSWEGVSGITYTVQGSTDLTSWTDITTVLGSDSTISSNVAPVTVVETFVTDVATAHALVPTGPASGGSWKGDDETAFSAAGGTTGWSAGSTGVGYERNNGYGPMINLDTEFDMFGKNASVYIRIPFQVSDANSVTSLAMGMRYDDGFVAYINGQQVASANAPGLLAWNTEASSSHPDNQADDFEPFNLDASIGSLVSGTNILAIHGFNTNPTSSDMLIQPNLSGEIADNDSYYWRIVVK